MSARDHLNALQFEHMETPERHEVNAYHEGLHVGTLIWNKQPSTTRNGTAGQPPGAIAMVITDPEHRRKGIGTAMLHEGRNYSPPPQHSQERTKAGDAWAASVSGAPPENADPLDSLPRHLWQLGFRKPFDGVAF